jgi:hypothetical protein
VLMDARWSGGTLEQRWSRDCMAWYKATGRAIAGRWRRDLLVVVGLVFVVVVVSVLACKLAAVAGLSEDVVIMPMVRTTWPQP